MTNRSHNYALIHIIHDSLLAPMCLRGQIYVFIWLNAFFSHEPPKVSWCDYPYHITFMVQISPHIIKRYHLTSVGKPNHQVGSIHTISNTYNCICRSQIWIAKYPATVERLTPCTLSIYNIKLYLIHLQYPPDKWCDKHILTFSQTSKNVNNLRWIHLFGLTIDKTII